MYRITRDIPGAAFKFDYRPFTLYRAAFHPLRLLSATVVGNPKPRGDFVAPVWAVLFSFATTGRIAFAFFSCGY